MTRSLALLAGAALLSLSACQREGEANAVGSDGNTVSASARPSGNLAEVLNGGGNARLLQAVRTAGLEETLRGPGPYTLLVPSDAALAALPPGALQAAQPADKAELTRILSYHILPGVILTEDIGRAIDNGRGKAVLATMAGQTITATRDGGNIILSDGRRRAVLQGGERQASNGVAHGIDGVLLPAREDAGAPR